MTGKILEGRYTIIKQIGFGGMAEVYLARDEILGRRVAIKILRERFLNDKASIEQFRREARMAACLEHPSIINIFDVCEEKGKIYIVMEYVEGITLKEFEEANSKIAPDLAVALTIQLADALANAHQHEVIHCDIKPQNIILTSKMVPIIVDFGISKVVTNETIAFSSSFMGSVRYLAPEQAEGLSVTAQSDIYSLGIVLYEMLTGRVPFEGTTALTIAKKQIEAKPPLLKTFWPEAPESLQKVMDKALAKDPRKRYIHADEMRRDLILVMGELYPENKIPYIAAMSNGIFHVEQGRVQNLFKDKDSAVLADTKVNYDADDKKEAKNSIGNETAVIGRKEFSSAVTDGEKDNKFAADAGKNASIDMDDMNAATDAESNLDAEADLDVDADSDETIIMKLPSFLKEEVWVEDKGGSEKTEKSGLKADSEADLNVDKKGEKGSRKANRKDNRQDNRQDNKKDNRDDDVTVLSSAALYDQKMHGSQNTGKNNMAADTEVTEISEKNEMKAGRDVAKKNNGTSDKSKGGTQKKKSGFGTLLKILAVIICLFCGALFYFLNHTTPNIAVPDVTGKSVVEAQKVLQERGFRVSLEEVMDPKLMPGQVIKQSPEADIERKEGAVINLTISRGLNLDGVPAVAGLSLEKAEELLEKDHFKVGNITYAWDKEKPEGLVISQLPGEGSKLTEGSAVDLVVNKEVIAKKIVPDIKGMDLEDAQERLKIAGLELGEVEEVENDAAKGTILAFSPKAGTEVEENSKVDVAISTGEERYEQHGDDRHLQDNTSVVNGGSVAEEKVYAPAIHEKKISGGRRFVEFVVPGKGTHHVSVILSTDKGQVVAISGAYQAGARLRRKVDADVKRIKFYVDGKLIEVK